MSTRYSAVAIGASAGAVDALFSVLTPLPADFPLPIFVVVHLPPDQRSVMADILRPKCAVHVEEAEDKHEIRPGTVHIAPPDYHMLVEKNGYISLSSDEPVLFSRPSIDVLFESALDAYGEALIGVILSGANHDGAIGLSLIGEAGGAALVQRPDEAFASAMPEAALAGCPSARALSLHEIPGVLQELSR